MCHDHDTFLDTEKLCQECQITFVTDWLSISLSNDLVESEAEHQSRNHEIAEHRVWRRRVAFPDPHIFFGGSPKHI